jgi:hypothetical protein
MQAAAESDSQAMASMRDEKSSLELLGNLTIVFTVFGLEILVLYASAEKWRVALFSLVAFGLAAASYRLTAAKARSYGNALEVVFDSQRALLAKALGLRKTENADDELELWKKASRLFLGGKPIDSVTDPTIRAPGAVITHSANITVDKASAAVIESPREHEPRSNETRVFVHYVFLYVEVLSDQSVCGINLVVIGLEDCLADDLPRTERRS